MAQQPMQPTTTGRDRLRDFFYHFIVFAFIMGFLLLVSSSPGMFVVALFWGMAVALHGVYAVFG